MKAHARHSQPETLLVADCRLQGNVDAKRKVDSSSVQQQAVGLALHLALASARVTT
jgi:hypothetical protein